MQTIVKILAFFSIFQRALSKTEIENFSIDGEFKTDKLLKSKNGFYTLKIISQKH
jgi:hypothetical protein